MSVSDITAVYHQDYQRESVSEKALRAWGEIGAVLSTRYPKREWCDVGCGGGGLVHVLRRRGHRAWGIEGSMAALGLLPVPIMLWDLRLPLRGVPSVDVVTCFDVAEHVGNADAVVWTCSTLARDTLIFGAAPPGQDGLGHIDLRPADEWTEMFRQQGLSFCPQETEILRREIEARPAHNHCWWVAKNACVYERTNY